MILKERLVTGFDLPASIDGIDLVNQLYGQNGIVSGSIDNSEREAVRDFLSGLFRVARNQYSHNNTSASREDLDFVVASINWYLVAKLATHTQAWKARA